MEARLPYNDVFLPHWKEFANALEQHRYYLKCISDENGILNKYNNHCLKLRLIDMELTEDIIDLLSKGLESTFFTSLELINNNSRQKVIDFALNYLKSNRIILELALESTSMGKKDMRRLCEILNDHPSLNKLSLIECKGEDIDGQEMFQMVKTSG